MTILVHPYGDYCHRQPLAYEPVRAACGGDIRVTNRFDEADLVVIAHSKDLSRYGDDLARQMGQGQKLVLMSEEPFWDTVWADDPLRRDQIWRSQTGEVPFTFLNHQTSTLYDFHKIPYFLLTDRAFFTRYSRWFHRNAQRSAKEWQTRFEQTTKDVAFIAEYRNEPRFDVAFDGQDLFGLATLRTQIALACETGRVLRMGAGWNQLPRRQNLQDWHLEKFLDFDGKCQILSAIENTHQNTYISEKIFDSFAMGAVALYIAGPQHRVQELIPDGSYLNLYGLDPAQAANVIRQATFDTEFLHAYMQAQASLAETFNDPSNIVREYARLGHALAHELGQIVSA